MAAEGQVIAVHSVQEWKDQLEQAKAAHKLVVVDFTATWCGPCRMMAPIFAELAKNKSDVVFLKVDVDELKAVAEECDIQAMPTFILFKNGEQVDKIVGADKVKLETLVTQHATASA